MTSFERITVEKSGSSEVTIPPFASIVRRHRRRTVRRGLGALAIGTAALTMSFVAIDSGAPAEDQLTVAATPAASPSVSPCATAGKGADGRCPSVSPIDEQTGSLSYLPPGWEQYAEKEQAVPTSDGRPARSHTRRYRDPEASGFLVIDVRCCEVAPLRPRYAGRANTKVRPGTTVYVNRVPQARQVVYNWSAAPGVQIQVVFLNTELSGTERDRIVAGVRS